LHEHGDRSHGILGILGHAWSDRLWNLNLVTGGIAYVGFAVGFNISFSDEMLVGNGGVVVHFSLGKELYMGK